MATNPNSNYVSNNRTIKLEGFAELEDQLLALSQFGRADLAARNTLVKALNKAMMPVLYQAAFDAPYDEKNDGPIHLRNTIRLDSRIPNNSDKKSDFVRDTDAAIAVVSAKKSAVSLAQEFGTRRIAAQPFLRPALDSQAENVLSTLKDELATIIPEYAKKLNKRRK